MSKILKLDVSGFKRLRAARITPDGALVEITGKNGQGKSSVLDAIQAALGGTRRAPETPVRKGYEKAEIVLDLGDIVVQRTFTKAGNAALVVTSADGKKMGSPQAVLDKLFGDLTFDPLSFSMAEPRKQVEIIRKVIGMEDTLTALDVKKRDLLDARSVAASTVKRLEAQAEGFKTVDPTGPVDPVDAAALATELTAVTDAAARLKRGKEWEAAQVAKVERLEQEIHALQKTLAHEQGQLEAGRRQLAEVDEATKKLRDADIIRAELTNIMAENERRTNRREAQRVRETLKVEAEELRMVNRKLEDLEAQKRNAIEGAKLPIPGLGFTEDGVTLNGLPFAQASTAEKIRASVAIGAAQAPTLKVVLVREGSLLDTDSLKVLQQAAEAAGLQVWIERVTDGERVGVVIEDGEVVAVAPGAAEKGGEA